MVILRAILAMLLMMSAGCVPICVIDPAGCASDPDDFNVIQPAPSHPLVAEHAWGFISEMGFISAAFDPATGGMVALDYGYTESDQTFPAQLVRISVDGTVERGARMRFQFNPSLLCVVGVGPGAHFVAADWLGKAASEFDSQGRIIWTNTNLDSVTKVLACDLNDDQKPEVLAATSDGVIELRRADGTIGRKFGEFMVIDLVSFDRLPPQQAVFFTLDSDEIVLYGAGGKARSFPRSVKSSYLDGAAGTIDGRHVVLGVSPQPLQVELFKTDGTLLWRIDKFPIERKLDGTQYSSSAAISSKHHLASITMRDGYTYVLSTKDGAILCSFPGGMLHAQTYWTSEADGTPLLILAKQTGIHAYRIRPRGGT
ncbi:MAG: hypothetical protein IT434_12865 [Phycisphaerales bacterium]|jgi:hypothetical protein|nr:hypothetical protein [Phycisphaerales bacterium]